MHLRRYLTEQLWMLGVGLIYAGTMLFDYWRASTGERTPISTVVPWIQQMILYAGVVLAGLVVVRAFWVYWTVRELSRHGHVHLPGHPHDHTHQEHHDHEGGCCCVPESELAALRANESELALAGAPAQGHHPGHHAEHEHEHDWSPWRFFVLLAPVLLVLLPLPWDEMLRAFERSKSRVQSEGFAGGVATPGDVLVAFGTWSFSADPLARSLAAALCQYRVGEEPASLEKALDYLEAHAEVPESAIRRTDVPQLEQVAYVPVQREQWKQFRRVEVEGLFQPIGRRPNQFALVRLRMACCANDSRPLSIYGVLRQPVRNLQPGDWVRVQGRLDFVQLSDGTWKAVVHTYKIEKAPLPPPAQFYVQ
ncbi:MAG: hypothetical protein NZM42_07860 [Gemmatales bacterium]|nr:hypothetical protein [Gemmatales bacterium]MDW8222895.1 hypothetical protein [Gemmatales bacterium]